MKEKSAGNCTFFMEIAQDLFEGANEFMKVIRYQTYHIQPHSGLNMFSFFETPDIRQGLLKLRPFGACIATAKIVSGHNKRLILLMQTIISSMPLFNIQPHSGLKKLLVLTNPLTCVRGY